ncbi:MAG: hypothetical protein ABR961_13050 [Thermoanaerobaculaceae bacterium]
MYFLIVSPRLPEAARHTPFAFDIGLAIDFVICVAIYVVLHNLIRPRTRR